MKVAILGAGGQLAHDLVECMGDWDLAPLRHSDLDVCNHQAVRTRLAEARTEVVINTTAFHRVDDCETEWEKAFLVNAHAVRNLALVCRDLGAVLVHLSTDYVFGGEKRTPYSEDDLPRPLSAYGVSKLAGEHFVRVLCPDSLVVRTSGLYGIAGSSGKGGNFVETMIRLAEAGKPIRVVDDQDLAPTYAADLAAGIKEMLMKRGRGLYHMTNSGSCSWFEFARAIFDMTGLHVDLSPTSTAAYGLRARRPSYSVMSQERAVALGLKRLRPWPEALRAYLLQRAMPKHLGPLPNPGGSQHAS
ncbi:MAG: dTDP-4-dehydrorhamnose reductase [Chloroflexi bacterium RBG_16_64_43]|nr:MAG: dTDP-4-dehydrorhamnose reductase [Chloroflexi bacterium RBG_16_64_43]